MLGCADGRFYRGWAARWGFADGLIGGEFCSLLATPPIPYSRLPTPKIVY